MAGFGGVHEICRCAGGGEGGGDLAGDMAGFAHAGDDDTTFGGSDDAHGLDKATPEISRILAHPKRLLQRFQALSLGNDGAQGRGPCPGVSICHRFAAITGTGAVPSA